MTAPLLVATVAVVGVLHTVVPDHWAPIVVVARQQGWSVSRTARAAAIAGSGHVASTLMLGIVLWAAGASLAVRYGHAVTVGASVALVVFGAWIGWTGWREVQRDGDDHAQRGHAHAHRHADGMQHVHWHGHQEADWHRIDGGAVLLHEHEHAIAGRTALLLILGSSPMLEGIPAFFAASTYGAGLLALMAVAFAASTIVTYVVLSCAGIAGLQRVSLGPVERYGEIISGAFVALVGIYGLVAP